MTEKQQDGLAFMLSSSNKETHSNPSSSKYIARRDKKVLIKDSDMKVQNVVIDNEDDNYGNIVELMRSIRNDEDKN